MADASNGNGNGGGSLGFGRFQFTLGVGQILMTVLAVLGTVWGVVAVTVSYSTGGIAQDAREAKALAQTQAASIADLTRENAALRNDFTRLSAQDCQIFAKIETQFGTVEALMNKTHFGDMRDTALLWEKVYSQPFPTIIYEVKIPHELQSCI